MVKRYWSKCLLGLVLGALLMLPIRASAKSYSNLYIQISDAKTALQNGDQATAKDFIQAVQSAFSEEEAKDSSAGQEVQEVLYDLLSASSLEQEDLVTLSTSLMAFEKEQNPVDIEAEKQDFQTKVYAALNHLEAAIATGDVAVMKKEYLTFNAIWTRNESIVRSTSIAHYGQIETAMSFLRSSMEVEPYNADATIQSLENLKASLDAFVSGKTVEKTSQITTLDAGIKVLEKALTAFKKSNVAEAQKQMKLFISNWPTFEGEVSTRSSRLYNQVETDTPIILVKGSETSYQDKLETLITELKAISSSGNYTALDAMLILLREGVEALLIVLALVGTLKASQQKKGLNWVYGGALAGLALSFVAAFLLQALFPAVASASNRELLEGFVGIFAVIMMVGVGIWLHSKSSSKAWQAYMDKQMAIALSSGGVLSMFGLSFLAVFREGAETILFYAGILPRITTQDFVLGVGLAFLSLGILAIIFVKGSDHLPVHLLFKLLTVMIYMLAFKMLGSSVHHLQLTDFIPIHVLPHWPAVEWIGLYPTMEVLGSQFVFLLLLAGIAIYQQKKAV